MRVMNVDVELQRKYRIEAMSEYLGVSTRTLHRYVSIGLIIKHKITNGNVLYSMSTELANTLN
jgi:DNA-binding transcriptional MerR regulator